MKNIRLFLIAAFCAFSSAQMAWSHDLRIEVTSNKDVLEVELFNHSSEIYELDVWKDLPRFMVVELWRNEIGGRLSHVTLEEIRDVFTLHPTLLIDGKTKKTFRFKLSELRPTAAPAASQELVNGLLKEGIAFGCDVRVTLAHLHNETSSEIHHVEGIGRPRKKP